MIIDCHVHAWNINQPYENCLARMDAAGVGKIAVLSYAPRAFGHSGRPIVSPEAALKDAMGWAAASARFIPFYWIDPLEGGAFDQVDAAVAAGIAGFKVICSRHYPGDDRPMQVFERIAKAGKPILFHSGILYSGTPSSKYNRPAGFEPLFFIPNLRFALAHVSWPWHDECLAMYGHFRNCKDKGAVSSEMFIDTTPGTPEIYREEVLRKIYTIGYDIEDNVLFGTDCDTAYSTESVVNKLEMDNKIFDTIGVCADTREKYFGKNFLRFLGDWGG